MKTKAIVLLGLILPLFANAQTLGDLAESGHKSLRAGEYQHARELFRTGSEHALETKNEEWLAKFWFYEGNTDLIEAGVNAEAAPDLAGRAAANYQRVLKARPDSGSAMVNLARAMTLLGKDEAADAWYRRAIKTGGKKQTLYREQYAEYLAKRDPEEAASQLREIVKAEPKSAKAHRQLVQAYQDPKSASRLPDYLLQQVKKGEVLSAQKAALDALTNPKWPSEYKDELMTVFAASLAGQHITPSDFASSDTAVALRKIAVANPTLVVGVRELFQTMRAGGQTKRYTWWTSDSSRTATISQLLRSQARISAQSGDDGRAEALYNNAVKLNGADDPKALLDLVRFYSERGNLRKIHRISKKYEYQLFKGKDAAYQRRDDQAIYDYHRTLASIYANQAIETGNWGSLNRVTSAAFQLEHAYRTAKRSEFITPDTQLVDQLAQSYLATRSQSAANNVRLEAATIYLDVGDTAAANKVLGQVNTGSLSNDQRLNYRRLSEFEHADLQTPVAPESLQENNLNNVNQNNMNQQNLNQNESP